LDLIFVATYYRDGIMGDLSGVMIATLDKTLPRLSMNV